MAQTQPATVVLNEASIVQSAPLRIGLNNANSTNYDQGQFCKNWLCVNNPALQGTIAEQVVPIRAGATTTTFQSTNIYDLAPAGIWAGAHYAGIASPSNSGFQLASGTLSTNAAAVSSSSTGVVYTTSSPATAPAKGDYASIVQEIDLATGGMCAYNSGVAQLNCVQGWISSTSGGAVISAQNADLPPSTYDLQTLTVNTTATGAAASITNAVDQTYTGKGGNFLTMWSGASYSISIKCKTASGTANVTLSVYRFGGGQNSSGTATCTNSWSTISFTFTGTETASTPVGTIAAAFSFPQGTLFKVCDAYLGQTSYSAGNPTIYNDTYLAALKAYGGDTIRLWDSAVGDTLDDMLRPLFGRHWQFWSQLKFYFSDGGGIASGYYDHLLLCQSLNVHVCSVVVPASWPLADYSNLVEFIAGTSGTYPSKRNALDALSGRATGPFTSSIPVIVLELTDEPWNTVLAGENMPDQGDGYTMTAYGLRASAVFSRMKADASWSAALKTAINCQSASSYACINTVLNNATNTDMVYLSTYLGSTLTAYDTLNHEFDPQSGFAWSNANDTTNGWVAAFISQVKTQAPAYTGAYGIYEGGMNVTSSTPSTTQVISHNSAMINAAEVVQAYMEQMKVLGVTVQNIFTATEDGVPSPLLWGIFKDPDGGQIAGQGKYQFRQIALGVQIANQCIGVGSTEYGATVTGTTLYSTSALNGFSAWSDIPYLTAYAFENGNNRCLLFTNTDPVHPATVSITGVNAPATATENLLLGASIAANNESPTPGVTIQTTPARPVTPTYTIPPYSVSAISWTVASSGTSISNVQASGLTEVAATITWTTSTPASSQVFYGTSPAYGFSTPVNPTLVTSHSVTVTGLTSGTLYDFIVASTPATGNRVVSSNYSFTTVTPPAISNVQVSSLTSSSATVTWTTNTPTTSQVSYGTSLAYGSSTSLNSALVTSHSVAVTGLNASTFYDFTVQSTDATGDRVISSNYSFTTATPLVLSNVVVSGITETGATITWTTSTPANSQVSYGTSLAYGSATALNPTLVTSHSAALTGLTKGTLYDFLVESTDASGNEMISSNQSFTTLATAGPSVTASGSGGSSSTVNSITTGTGGSAFACGSKSAAIAFVSIFSDETVTVSDSTHNSGWTPYGPQYGNSSSGYGQWFYNPSLSSSVTSVTATFGSTTRVGIIAHCISGLSASPADFSQATSTNPWNTYLTRGIFTTTSAPEIVFTGVSESAANTLSAGRGWTAGLSEQAGSFLATEYRVFFTARPGEASGQFASNVAWSSITIGLK